MDKKDRVSKFKTIIIERPKERPQAEGGRFAGRIPRAERRRQREFRSGESVFERAPRTARRSRFRRDGDNAAGGSAADDGFVANVRFSEPILSVTALSKVSVWRRDLPYNIAIGLLLLSFFSIFCMMIDEPLLIAFACPAVIVYTALAMLDSFDKSNIRYIACGVIAVLLIAAAVIFHGKIGPGFAYIMDEFYDVAEDAQAYIYDRFSGGDSASEADCYIAMIWISSLLGMLMAAIPARFRRIAGMVLTAVVILALAYYGIEPSWLCICAMVLALLLTLAKDNIFAALPLLLAAVILFGAVILIDPGESYTISRMDENTRDRIAFHSALLESGTSETPDLSGADSLAEQEEAESEGSPFSGENAAYYWIGLGVAILALLGAVAFIIIRNYKRRQALVRKGLDSKDPREAVTAMFPYSVRWIKAAGLESPETREEPFSAMTDDIRRVYDGGYASRFDEMYSLWREAAYSDHDISEDDRAAMDRFTKDTVTVVSDKLKTGQKLRMRFKHAL